VIKFTAALANRAAEPTYPANLAMKLGQASDRLNSSSTAKFTFLNFHRMGTVASQSQSETSSPYGPLQAASPQLMEAPGGLEPDPSQEACDPSDVRPTAGSARAAELPQERLPFNNHLVHTDRDPQALANRLALHYEVLDFGPCRGHESSFMHRTSTCQAGELTLSGGYTTPVQGTIGSREGIGSVNLILSGEIHYECGGQIFPVNAKRPLFFSPGNEYKYTIKDHFNGVVFDVDLERLKRTAAAIAGIGISERRFTSQLDFDRVIQPSDNRSEQLLNVLRQSFRLFDQNELAKTGDLDVLNIDDLIYRVLALLLCPNLGQIIQNEPTARSGREQIFEDLLEWSRANLHTPIKLSQLEERSGYSRRNLQLAFQQRFGCGPIQWVRKQRLEQARQDLLNPTADESVAGIAKRYGFSSLAVFSRDFRSRYGVPPSQLLREGKRHQQGR
jgi:AraC-like DNA-binding protein